MQDQITLLVMLVLGLWAVWWGFGKLTGFGGGTAMKHENGTGSFGRVVTIIFVGLFGLMWLSNPGSQEIMAGTIAAAWANFVNGVVVPVATILGQIGLVVAIGYVMYLVIRHRRR